MTSEETEKKREKSFQVLLKTKTINFCEKNQKDVLSSSFALFDLERMKQNREKFGNKRLNETKEIG